MVNYLPVDGAAPVDRLSTNGGSVPGLTGLTGLTGCWCGLHADVFLGFKPGRRGSNLLRQMSFRKKAHIFVFFFFSHCGSSCFISNLWLTNRTSDLLLVTPRARMHQTLHHHLHLSRKLQITVCDSVLYKLFYDPNIPSANSFFSTPPPTLTPPSPPAPSSASTSVSFSRGCSRGLCVKSACQSSSPESSGLQVHPGTFLCRWPPLEEPGHRGPKCWSFHTASAQITHTHLHTLCVCKGWFNNLGTVSDESADKVSWNNKLFYYHFFLPMMRTVFPRDCF